MKGEAVRVWGLLANGLLFIHVLDKGDVMNSEIYSEIVEDMFPDWLGPCEYLVQDFERALRTQASRDAIKRSGLKLVERFPTSSQDLNAIENIWRLLRERLYETMPTTLESRDGFVKRLRAAVRWLNWNKQEAMWYLCTNQKERAQDVLNLDGARTAW